MKAPFWVRWRWAQLRERLAIGCANRLPRWLVYRAAIRLGVHATQGPYGDQVVPELHFMDALQRWDR